MKTLLIVDLQKDFFSPEGSLYVSGAEVLPAKVAAVVAGYDAVVFTLDWHGPGHCSFKENGGIWPAHCVRYTEGSSLPLVVLSAIDHDRQVVGFYKKGIADGREQYGAFDDMIGSDFSDWQAIGEADEIDICGLCGDFCVSATARALSACGFRDKLVMLKDLILSIDDGTVLDKTIDELNLKVK